MEINSAIRTVFSIVYLTSFLKRIKEFAQQLKIKAEFSPLFIFLGYFIVKIIGAVVHEIWLISVLSFLLLLKPYYALQLSIIKSAKDRMTIVTSYNIKHKVLLGIGVLWWLIVILGFFMGDYGSSEYVTYTL